MLNVGEVATVFGRRLRPASSRLSLCTTLPHLVGVRLSSWSFWRKELEVNKRITLSSLVTLLAIIVVPHAPALVQARQQSQSPIVPGATTQPRAGFIEHLEITSISDAYGGASFGSVGPYQVIGGIVHGKIYPRHPANVGIVDLDRAPIDADGFVAYSTDFVILRPKNAATAKRVLFYDVVNRGNKVATGTFNGATG